MRFSLPLLAAVATLFGASTVQAVDDPGASEYAPGQKMQDKDNPDHPGASEYAPGQQKHTQDQPDQPGASEYAPGQQE